MTQKRMIDAKFMNLLQLVRIADNAQSRHIGELTARDILDYQKQQMWAITALWDYCNPKPIPSTEGDLISREKAIAACRTIFACRIESVDDVQKAIKKIEQVITFLPSISQPTENVSDKIEGLQSDLNELVRVCKTKPEASIKDFVAMNYPEDKPMLEEKIAEWWDSVKRQAPKQEFDLVSVLNHIAAHIKRQDAEIAGLKAELKGKV
jgi:hypothetical protein